MSQNPFLSFCEGLPDAFADQLQSPETQANFMQISGLFGSLLQFAIPAVKMVANNTQNRTVDQVSAVLDKVGVLATVDPNTPPNDPSLKGLLLHAASAALQGNLQKAVSDAGEAGLVLGTQTVRNAAEVHPSLVTGAAQVAFTFLKMLGSLPPRIPAAAAAAVPIADPQV